ncbi:MAG: radical SAM protein, partial [Candidatus Nanoarchaeia archaeon]
GYSLKIDTNGSFPEKLKELIEKGFVDYVAMDIKAGKDQYSRVANADADMNKIENSIKLITNSGIDYEFRTTVVKNLHDIEEVKKIAEWINNILGRKPKKFVLQGFKNKGKLLDGVFKQEKDVETDYLEELKKAVKDYFEIVEIKG